MALVVLLRGANLGKRRFSPKAVEKALSDLDVVSIGAAGTFVVRKRVAAAALRKRVEGELPFEPAPMVIATGTEVLAAFEAGRAVAVPDGARRFATAMGKKPAKRPRLPLDVPEGAQWGVRVAAVEGRFAIGARRRFDETGVYPNEVVERAFGTDATTRDWPTIEKIAKALSA